MPAKMSAAQIGELTSDAFAREYPELCDYFKDLDQMSFQMLFARDELHDFWSGPVVDKEGHIVQRRRILWNGCPLRPEIPTLAIRMCSKMERHSSKTKSLCMRFNSAGCSADPGACGFLHVCLCCGSLEHGFRQCEMSHKLYQEAEKFQGNFGLDPLDPSRKWAGNSLEKVLLKLVGSDFDTEMEKLDEKLPIDVPDPLLYEAESTDASKSSEAADLSESSEELEVEREAYGPISSTPEADRAVQRLPQDWTVDEVASWLLDLEDGRHGRYVENFKLNLITGKALSLLSPSELKEDLQVRELRNRKVIHQEIQKLFADCESCLT